MNAMKACKLARTTLNSNASYCKLHARSLTARRNVSFGIANVRQRVILQASLADIELNPIVNIEGYIHPDIPDGSEASVFAVYDSKQKLQYVGFSKDIRNTLRTLFSRRPDKAYYYKAEYLNSVDQKAMMQIRDAWFEECGGPPSGNKLPMERAAWQQPVDSGAISHRGKQAAAEEQATQQLRQIKERGCKEEFIVNPALLPDGQVDFLPAEALTPEALEAMRQKRIELAKKQRSCKTVVDGQEKGFNLLYRHKFATNGGYMMDVVMTYDNQDSEHRLVVGKEFYEPNGVDPESVVEAALALLLNKKIPRKTEGMLLSSQFPVNYFSISQLEQWYEEEFAQHYELVTGEALKAHGDYWRFNRLNDYGPVRNESLSGLQIAVGKYE